MSTTAQRLAAQGRRLQLADGSFITVKFDFWSMHLLEDQFGGVQHVALLLNSGSSLTPMFTDLAKVILATLDGQTHERRSPVVDGAQTVEQVEWTLPDVIRVLDSRRVREYIRLVGEAFDEALPEPNTEAADDAPGEADPATGGPAGSTSPPSPSDAAPVSSGL